MSKVLGSKPGMSCVKAVLAIQKLSNTMPVLLQYSFMGVCALATQVAKQGAGPFGPQMQQESQTFYLSSRAPVSLLWT